MYEQTPRSKTPKTKNSSPKPRGTMPSHLQALEYSATVTDV